MFYSVDSESKQLVKKQIPSTINHFEGTRVLIKDEFACIWLIIINYSFKLHFVIFVGHTS